MQPRHSVRLSEVISEILRFAEDDIWRRMMSRAEDDIGSRMRSVS